VTVSARFTDGVDEAWAAPGALVVNSALAGGGKATWALR